MKADFATSRERFGLPRLPSATFLEPMEEGILLLATSCAKYGSSGRVPDIKYNEKVVDAIVYVAITGTV